MDDRPGAFGGADRLAPGLAQDPGEGEVHALERLPHARLQRLRRIPERVDHLVGALVPLAPLADAAVEDLLEVIAAAEASDLGGPGPLASGPLDQHAQQL